MPIMKGEEDVRYMYFLIPKLIVLDNSQENNYNNNKYIWNDVKVGDQILELTC